MVSGVGFSELLLLFVIGLLILGPERLPRVASQLGRWVGKARRTANQLRFQMEREIALADIERSQKKPKNEKPRDQTQPSPDAKSAEQAQAPGAAPDAGAAPGGASKPATAASEREAEPERSDANRP